jgi:hypothetical protein
MDSKAAARPRADAEFASEQTHALPHPYEPPPPFVVTRAFAGGALTVISDLCSRLSDPCVS